MQHAGSSWFAVNTAPGQEYAVERRLKRSGRDVLLPECKVRRRKRRTITIERGPLFLTYLLVRLDLERDEWSLIEAMMGVVRLLKVDGQPFAISDIDMARVRAHARNPLLIEFSDRQRVQVAAGAFEGREGRYISKGSGDSGEDIIRVLMDIMGAQRLVTIPEALVVPA